MWWNPVATLVRCQSWHQMRLIPSVYANVHVMQKQELHRGHSGNLRASGPFSHALCGDQDGRLCTTPHQRRFPLTSFGARADSRRNRHAVAVQRRIAHWLQCASCIHCCRSCSSRHRHGRGTPTATTVTITLVNTMRAAEDSLIPAPCVEFFRVTAQLREPVPG